MSDLANRLAATLRHLPTDAAPHRRLEIARMTVLTDPDHVRAIIDRLESARNQARHFGLVADDKASDFDRANALRCTVSAAGDYPIACLATALDELPELSRDAQAALAALLAELAAERSRAPSREWWADAAQIAGRGCVSLPDAMAAIKAAIAAKDAEIARLKAESSTVGGLLASAPELSDFEVPSLVARIGAVYDLTIRAGRARAIAAMRGAEATIVSSDEAATRGPIGGQLVADPAKIGGAP